MRRFAVPPSIALVAMGVFCLVSLKIVPVSAGAGTRTDAKRAEQLLLLKRRKAQPLKRL
jgi:hypothetical protein